MDKSKWLDEDGYPGTIQWDGSYDGGDTAAIIGTIEALDDKEPCKVPPIPFSNGFPIRHPDDTKWVGQPNRFSRDQLIAALCGLIGQDNSVWSYAFYQAHKHRYFLTAWNTKGNGQMDLPNKFPDVCGPEVWALWIRLKRPWWARLVLCTFDLQTLVGAIQWRWFTPKTNRVTRNHMLVCLATIEHQPTSVSRLACVINDWTELVSRWDDHCTAVGEYPTADLFRKKLEKLGLK